MITLESLPITPRQLGHCRYGIPVTAESLYATASLLLGDGMRLALVAGHDDGSELRVVYLFTAGPPDLRIELHLSIDRAHPSVPSLASLSFPASRFERELHDLFGIEPIGHPQPTRLVAHQHWPIGWFPMRHDAGAQPPMIEGADPYPFVPVTGPGVYEIPVGPVHAGLIEPGHFRFWVVGETILRMRSRLWFAHKGIERLFEERALDEALLLAERISGDSAVAHSSAFAQAVEDAMGIEIAPDATSVRGLLLELERIYNHVADIGTLANDVGFGLGNADAMVLREHLLQLNEEITGHRLLRSGVVIGGATVKRLPTDHELVEIQSAFEDLVDLISHNALVMERFSGTAVLRAEDAVGLGVVGMSARASGLPFDARLAHPSVELTDQFSPAVLASGDVMARYLIRVAEIRSSLVLIRDFTARIGATTSVVLHSATRRDTTNSTSGVGIVEGWRGAVVHRVELDATDHITRTKVVDPSFSNWPALAVSLADTIVPDFPLANKSFNFSYAANDL